MRAEPSPEDLTAIIDTREQRPLDLSPLPSKRGSLTVGDYSLRGLEDVVAVERKSLEDLTSSLGAGRRRFDQQVRNLLSVPHRLLVCECSWDELERGAYRSNLAANAATGSLLGYMAKGLPVVMAGDHERAGRYVSRFLFLVARRRWREARVLCPETPVGATA